MTVTENRRELENQQEALMRQYKTWEEKQSEYSYDTDFCRYCQSKMQSIDDACEQIRRQLEGVEM